MAAGPAAGVPAVLGTPPAAVNNGTQRDEKKSASKTVTDTIIGGTIQHVPRFGSRSATSWSGITLLSVSSGLDSIELTKILCSRIYTLKWYTLMLVGI